MWNRWGENKVTRRKELCLCVTERVEEWENQLDYFWTENSSKKPIKRARTALNFTVWLGLIVIGKIKQPANPPPSPLPLFPFQLLSFDCCLGHFPPTTWLALFNTALAWDRKSLTAETINIYWGLKGSLKDWQTDTHVNYRSMIGSSITLLCELENEMPESTQLTFWQMYWIILSLSLLRLQCHIFMSKGVKMV